MNEQVTNTTAELEDEVTLGGPLTSSLRMAEPSQLVHLLAVTSRTEL